MCRNIRCDIFFVFTGFMGCDLNRASSNFSQLKHLKLLLLHSPEDLDSILSLASFLRAAPLIEELEIHVSTLLALTSCTREQRRQGVCLSAMIICISIATTIVACMK